MAENKKGIIVYADWIDKFEELTDDEAGKLIKHFFRYVNDLNPEAPDRTTKLMFIDIKNTLKRDLAKYSSKKNERSKSGILGNLKRYNEDLYNDVINKKTTLDQALKVAESRKTSHSDKNLAKLAVSVSDSVTVSVSDKEKEEVVVKENLKKNHPHIYDRFLIGQIDLSKAVELSKEDVSNIETFDEEVYKDIEVLKKYYEQNLRLRNAFSDSNGYDNKKIPKRLEQFNKHLATQSRFKETFKEYAKYFLAWHRKAPTKQEHKRDSQGRLIANFSNPIL